MKGLFCFDMEGVILDGEVLDEVATELGIGNEVKEITKDAMEGRIDFSSAVRRRLELLKGFDRFENIVKKMPLVSYIQEFISMLKENGHYTAMVTGSFDKVARIVAEKVNINEWVANSLEIKNNQITGNFELAYNDKSEVLRKLREKLQPDFTVAIGDGANDINMLKEADIGIAFKSKDILKDNDFIYCEDAREMIRLFNNNKRVAIDTSIHPISYKLFSAISDVTISDLLENIPQYSNVVVIRTKTKVNKEFIERLKHIEVIATATTGTDHIDINFAKSRGIKVLDAKGENSDSVADYVMVIILNIGRSRYN